MATKLATYGFINAKLRTRLSKTLEDPELMALLRAETAAEVVSLLDDTEYQAAAAAFADSGDIQAAEARLFETEIRFFMDIAGEVPGKPGNFISRLLLRYEVETLKRALRLWFERRIKQRDIGDELEYLYKGFPRLQILPLVETQSLEEIAGLLAKTPYGAIIAGEAERDLRKTGLFALESSLDKFYFAGLLSSMEMLTKADREIAKKLIGVEIDLENMERIVRFKELYGFSQERLLDYIIPSGAALRSGDLSGDSGEFVKSYIAGRYSGLTPIIEAVGKEKYSNLMLLEAVLNEVLALEVKRVLLGYPFTLGIILAYFFLKRREVRRIILILNAKAYDLDEERVRALL
jgi:V/A-type H+/Na+-transporting ATPase subunit C